MLKRLYACVREFKTAALLTPLFILGEAIIECLIPYRIAMLINNLNTNGVALESIITDGLILAAMACASLLCGTLAAITRQARDLHEICVMICTNALKSIRLPTSTGFLPRLS